MYQKFDVCFTLWDYVYSCDQIYVLCSFNTKEQAVKFCLEYDGKEDFVFIRETYRRAIKEVANDKN